MLDIGLLAKHLQELRGGRSVEMPVYNWGGPGKPGYREPDKIQLFEACPLIIVEGIFAMDKRLQVYADTKVFVYADEEKSRQRRIRRDIIEREKTEEGSNVKWYHTVLPMFKQHVMPRIVDADMLIFNNGDLPNEFLE